LWFIRKKQHDSKFCNHLALRDIDKFSKTIVFENKYIVQTIKMLQNLLTCHGSLRFIFKDMTNKNAQLMLLVTSIKNFKLLPDRLFVDRLQKLS